MDLLLERKTKREEEGEIKLAHISIEGMDGVGKTTICKMLANKLGYKFIEKNLHYLFDEDEKFDNYIKIRDKVNANKDRIFTSWFYGLGNIYLYTMFKNENIITDRHFLSNYAWSGTQDNVEVYDLLVKKLGYPDLTVILYANEKAILTRLKNRDKNDTDIGKEKLSKEKYEKMIFFAEKYNIPYMLIDTSDKTPDEIVELIMKRIEGRY